MSLTSCVISSSSGETGNKNIVSKEFSISDYSKLDNSGAFTIVYEQKPDVAPYCRLEVDDNLVEYVSVEVENSTLKTRTTKKGLSFSSKCFIYTNSTSLNAINNSGSGDAKLNASESLIANVGGSGSVEYKGSPKHTDKSVTGSGSIRAKK